MAAARTVRTTRDRPFRDDHDFWRIRQLLVDTHPTTPVGFNWEVRRWDGWRFYNADLAWKPEWTQVVQLWEAEDGTLVGVVHPEGIGDAHLQVAPEYRHLEEEMIAWAETHLARPIGDTRVRELCISVFEYDSTRRELLERRGYEQLTSGGYVRRLRLEEAPISLSGWASGYTLRATRAGDRGDGQRVADILNAAFHRDFHTAEEHCVFARHAPSFRADLDLAAVTPDGTFASYVGVPYDEANHCGIFEPVCTHPDHLRKGLARALMLEALRRLQALGANEVLVGTGDAAAANRLYESIGFTEAYREVAWRKEIMS